MRGHADVTKPGAIEGKRRCVAGRSNSSREEGPGRGGVGREDFDFEGYG